MKTNLWVKDNFIIYGKVECHHCGSNVELLEVQTPDLTHSIICLECFNGIPTYDEYMNDQLNLTIDKELLHE